MVKNIENTPSSPKRLPLKKPSLTRGSTSKSSLYKKMSEHEPEHALNLEVNRTLLHPNEELTPLIESASSQKGWVHDNNPLVWQPGLPSENSANLITIGEDNSEFKSVNRDDFDSLSAHSEDPFAIFDKITEENRLRAQQHGEDLSEFKSIHEFDADSKSTLWDDADSQSALSDDEWSETQSLFTQNFHDVNAIGSNPTPSFSQACMQLCQTSAKDALNASTASLFPSTGPTLPHNTFRPFRPSPLQGTAALTSHHALSSSTTASSQSAHPIIPDHALSASTAAPQDITPISPDNKTFSFSPKTCEQTIHYLLEEIFSGLKSGVNTMGKSAELVAPTAITRPVTMISQGLLELSHQTLRYTTTAGVYGSHFFVTQALPWIGQTSRGLADRAGLNTQLIQRIHERTQRALDASPMLQNLAQRGETCANYASSLKNFSMNFLGVLTGKTGELISKLKPSPNQ